MCEEKETKMIADIKETNEIATIISKRLDELVKEKDEKYYFIVAIEKEGSDVLAILDKAPPKFINEVGDRLISMAKLYELLKGKNMDGVKIVSDP